MPDFTLRSDQIDVEQIMRQIRARIKEKRGVDYTEEEIRELANVKLERFLDPRALRSDLLEHYRGTHAPQDQAPQNYSFDDTTIYASHRAPLRWMRKLLNPLLKLLFNPNPLIHVLHMQSEINERTFKQLTERETLQYEVITNLVLELTRQGIETRNLKMRVESLSTRLDFDERRARALEGVVQYRPGALATQPSEPAAPEEAESAGATGEGDAAGRAGKRRRRRRGRRRGPGEEAGGPADTSAAEETQDRPTHAGDQARPAPDAPAAHDGGTPDAQ